MTEKDKILYGLALASEKLIEFKKQKKSELVEMIDNKIVRKNFIKTKIHSLLRLKNEKIEFPMKIKNEH